jgi:hypothetical protein
LSVRRKAPSTPTDENPSSNEPRTALQRILKSEQADLVEVSDKYSINYLAGLLRTRRLPGVRLRPAVVGMSHERMDENVAAYLSSSEISRRFCDWYMKWIYFPMFDHHITVSDHTAGVDPRLVISARTGSTRVSFSDVN